jgi:hypothetical protein
MSGGRRGRKRKRELPLGTWVWVWFESEAEPSLGQITRFARQEEFYVRFLQAGKICEFMPEEWTAPLKLSEERAGLWQLASPPIHSVNPEAPPTKMTTSAATAGGAAAGANMLWLERQLQKMKALLVESGSELMRHDNFDLAGSINRCLAEHKAQTDCGGVRN